jgi:hypothetical protein
VSERTSVLLKVLLPKSRPCWTESFGQEFASSIRAERMPPGMLIILTFSKRGEQTAVGDLSKAIIYLEDFLNIMISSLLNSKL